MNFNSPWTLDDCSLDIDWTDLGRVLQLASVPLDLGYRPFSSHAPMDPIYTSGRVVWHAHVFVYGHRVAPDRCPLFRQVGGKPASPVTAHAVAICRTFLADRLAALE